MDSTQCRGTLEAWNHLARIRQLDLGQTASRRLFVQVALASQSFFTDIHGFGEWHQPLTFVGVFTEPGDDNQLH